jgi:branched-chain amino acid transport system ATP-binding protein
VLENGGIKMQGEAEALRNDPRVIESYLGLASKHQDMLST